MSVNSLSLSRKRRVLQLWATVVLLIVSATAWGLPDNPRDPPLPPSTFGNLFEDGSLAIHSCRILSNTGTQAVLNFTSTFPRTEVSYWQRTANWSTWQAVTGSSYTCTSPNCLWGGAQVRIRGCDRLGVCHAAGCTIRLGVSSGGPPAVSPVALPTTASTVAGCAQTGHTTVRFEARWIGAPSAGYPAAEDELGNSLALTRISRVTVGGVEVGTYTIPAPATWVDGDLWVFKFALASSRVTESTVQVRDNCLQPPVIEHVATGGTRIALALGQQVQSAANLELAVVTGNAGLALINPALMPAQAFDTPFSPPAVSSGNQLDLAWIESGDAWDGLRYTSPPGTVQLTGVPCATGSAASYWITGSADITLNEDVAWTNGPLVETDACTPVSPGAPVAGTNIGVAATWQAITEGTGWRVQVRAARDLGLVSSTADYQGGLWGGVTSLRALRSPPANCLAGERLVGGLCVPCVDYQACVGGSLVTQQHCATGPAPVSASASSYQACVGGIVQTQQECLNPGDIASADAPCTLANCATDERVVNGSCEACPEYQICSAGSLLTDKYCGVGAAPGDAREVMFDSCVGGVTTPVTECVADGDPTPMDSACPPCTPPAPGSVTYELDSSADVNLPDSTEWVAGPSIRTNACGGSPPATSASTSDSRISFGAFVAEAGGGSWPIRVAATSPGGEVYDLFYWLGWNTGGSAWYFRAKRDPLTCAAGQRAVNGVCEVCPTHQVCSNGITVDEQFCGSGNAPADAACVTSCPPNERLVAGVCGSCLTHWECSAGRRVQREFCGAGSPPPDARNETVRNCVGGVQQTNTVCVAAGDPRPADTPCTSCQAGQRLVAGSCQTCPTYQVCDSSGNLESRTFCDPGNQPISARRTWNYVCVNGSTTTAWQCIGEGGLAADPGDVLCPGDSCITVNNCSDTDGWGISSVSIIEWEYCDSNPIGWPMPQIVSRQECLSPGTNNEFTDTHYYCVGNGGLASMSDVPANDACPSDSCQDYWACSSAYTTNQYAGSLGVEREYCGDDVPANSSSPRRDICVGGVDYPNARICIGVGGYDSDPGDQPCVMDCPADQRPVNGFCRDCPTYWGCNGNYRVEQTWCDAGRPPANARYYDVEVCRNGVTREAEMCVADGESVPPDDPCPVSCASNERLVNGRCESCPTYEVCSNGRTVDRNHCSAGNPPADRPCATSCSSGERVVNGSCEACPTYQVCSNGRTQDRQHCSTGNPPTDRPCVTSCSSGERLVNGSCEACPTYQVCSNGRTVDRQHCGTGNPPTDRPCVTSCSSGERLVNGACEACPTYQVCSNGRTQDRQHCSTGNPPTDRPCATSCSSGERLVNGSCEACPTYQVCSNGRTVDRQHCSTGSPPADRPCPTACPAGQELVNGVCVTCQRTAEPSCAEGETWTWNQNACQWNSSRVSRPACSEGQTWTWNEGTCGWRSRSVSEPSCPSGQQSNWDSNACGYGPCQGCPTGTRLVNGSCVTCPTHKICDGTGLTTSTYCGSGTTPVDAVLVDYEACVNGVDKTLTACVPPGGTAPIDDPCRTCVDYKVCSGNSLATMEYCGDGSPPANAWIARYEACVNGAAVTRSACVAGGGTAPPDETPCCVDYKACSGTLLVTEQYCGSGSPPGDAWLASYLSCPGGVTRAACVAYGGTAPADETPCCVDYKACSGTSLVTEQYCGTGSPPVDARLVDYKACSGNLLVTEQYCGTGSPPGNAWLASYLSCPGGVTRAACVAYGGTAPADETPCCVDYKACSGTSLVTRQHCGSGSPPDDARLATYLGCVNGVTTSLTICVAANVIVDPIDDPCPTCVDYQACLGNSLVTREYCGDSPPGNARLNDYKVCSGGALSTQAECIAPGGSETTDAVTGKKTYCDNGAKQIDDICGAGSDLMPSSCPPGEQMNAAGCCVTCPPDAEPACTGARVGQAPDWNAASCRYDWDTVSASACYASGNTGYVYDQWSATSCAYTTSSRSKPTNLTACQSASWTSCAWSVADNAQEQPDDTACGPATLNSSCAWVAASPPAEPTCQPGYVTDYRSANCEWNCIADPAACVQPAMPACPTPGNGWDWNQADCQWDAIVRGRPQFGPSDVLVWEEQGACIWNVFRTQDESIILD